MSRETFVTRVYRRSGSGAASVDEEFSPTDSVRAAVSRGDAACKAGKYVVVKSDRTSDGSRWPGHQGRVVATCERKKWLVETYLSLSGTRERRRGRKSCPSNVGKTRAPARLRRGRR